MTVLMTVGHGVRGSEHYFIATTSKKIAAKTTEPSNEVSDVDVTRADTVSDVDVTRVVFSLSFSLSLPRCSLLLSVSLFLVVYHIPTVLD